MQRSYMYDLFYVFQKCQYRTCTIYVINSKSVPQKVWHFRFKRHTTSKHCKSLEMNCILSHKLMRGKYFRQSKVKKCFCKYCYIFFYRFWWLRQLKATSINRIEILLWFSKRTFLKLFFLSCYASQIKNLGHKKAIFLT